MKLPKRFLIVPVVIASFSYLFYTSYKDVKNRTLNEFNTGQFTLAKQASRSIESFFIYYQRELQFLSNLKYVSELNDQGKDLLADFYKSNSDQIEAISVVDSRGVLIYTYPINNGAIGQNISLQPHIKTVIETHKPTVSDVFTSVQGFKTIAYHVPIISGKEYRGSIAILIPIDKLGQRFIENIKTGATGYAWMISEDGIELFNAANNQSGKSSREVFKNYPSVLELIDRAAKESEGTSICYFDPTNKGEKGYSKTLSAFYRISFGNTFWTIFIFTPEKEVYAKLTSFRNRLYILISLIIMIMMIYFYLSFKASNILKEEKKRKVIEKTLIESEKRFRIMFDLSPAGMVLIDKEGIITEVNSSICKTLGFSKNEILGQNIRLFASPKKAGEIEENISEILSGKTMIHEVTNIKKDGTTCLVALYETLINLPDGTPGILSVSNDITERKRVEMELISAKDRAEESDRLKSAFLTNMSHELRTPLNAIIGFSGLMVESGPDQNSTTYSQVILKSGQHLLTLVEDIFDTTMIETGQIKINYEKVDLVSLLEEVRDIIQVERLRDNKNEVELILNLEGAEDKKYLVTDSRKLKQVLMNLLRNALKFTNTGSIEFGFTVMNDAGNIIFRFYVKDTGIGIEKKYHKTIFNMFRQIDDTHTREFGGMGIGLSIAKKIIELLGGKIWVESVPSVGSVFYFTIPALQYKNKKYNITDEKALNMEKKYEGKTILIAEDEQSNFDFLKILLTRMNIRVLWAKNGLEAVNLCETDPSIDLVFMDIKMPLLNGYEATRLIKNKRPDLPVIAQTAYAMISDKVEAEDAGCDGYLAKPIKIKQITDILENHL